MRKQYIYSDQLSLWGERECLGFGSENFYIKEIERDLANEIIIKNHYSKKIFNNSYIHLGLFENGNIKGVLQYGHLMEEEKMRLDRPTVQKRCQRLIITTIFSTMVIQ